MNKKMKRKLSNALSCHCELNRKALRLKRSWDEVEAMISRGNKCCKSADDNKDCKNKHKGHY